MDKSNDSQNKQNNNMQNSVNKPSESNSAKNPINAKTEVSTKEDSDKIETKKTNQANYVEKMVTKTIQ